MPKPVHVARIFDIDICEKVLYKEQETMDCIMKAFRGENVIFQHTIGKHRIDLYFPEHKLTIECDEFGNKDRDLKKEIQRQKFLDRNLKCKFIRYNPDMKGFNAFNTINEIFQHIKNNISRVNIL